MTSCRHCPTEQFQNFSHKNQKCRCCSVFQNFEMIGPKNCLILESDLNNEPPTYTDCCSAQLMVDIVTDIATVENSLSGMACEHGCHAMLPSTKDIDTLHGLACDWAQFTFVAFLDDQPAIKTRYDLAYIRTWATEMMQKIVTFCFMHCCRQHQIYSLEAIQQHVSKV